MVKGETAMDVRKKIREQILKALESRKEINLKITLANFCLETGYTEKFVMTVFEQLQNAEQIFINDDGMVRLSAVEVKRHECNATEEL